MTVLSDKEYLETKLIKQGKASLGWPFKQLADWVNETFGVNTMNITYDRIEHNKRPRLSLVFELARDEATFFNQDGFTYSRKRQKVIADKFNGILATERTAGVEETGTLPGAATPDEAAFSTQDLWVAFGSFEPAAMTEANESVPQHRIEALKAKFAHFNLWEVSRCFSITTFFFYTREQVDASRASGIRETLQAAYFELLKPYDEFGYFKPESFSAYFDSKENFDTNYQSNWYYYYK